MARLDRIGRALTAVLFVGLSGSVAFAQSPDEGGGAPDEKRDSTYATPVHTDADVHFLHGMIRHHEQAVQMVALVSSRTQSRDIQLLSMRIDVSQQDEIAWMQDWLERRDESSDEGHGADARDHAPMPGMLTTEEMERLASATGADFDRLFLELMIHHHEGALAMVSRLLSTPGAAQEPEIFRFASDVDADQRAEIARMRGMLAD